ncbi:MAG: AraC family transcriptional regulator [Flavobacterium sp.]
MEIVLNMLDRDEEQRLVSGIDDVRISMMLIIGFVLFFFFYLKKINAKQKLKYETLITDLELGYDKRFRGEVVERNTATSEIIINKQKKVITDETINTLLFKLSEFEKSGKYTDQKMSLSTLSSMLNTNTKYLAEIIKQYKGKKFRDYINGLRIDYISELLANCPEYREYKISYLAECSGFSSRVVFAVVFKKETGISPSYFINNLKQEETVALKYG